MATENNNRPWQQSGNGNPDQGEQGDRNQDKGKQQGDQGRAVWWGRINRSGPSARSA